MIGKVKIGRSFTGICCYIFREDKNAWVLDAEGVRTDSAAHMAVDFEFQQAQRPGLGNAVMHVALALPAEDAAGRSPEQLSELLREVGRAYIREMKLENTQWVLVQHFDKAHPHAHLVVNRVDNDGKTIPDNFIGQESRRVCKVLEVEMGLTVAEERGRKQVREVAEPTNRQATAKTLKERRDANWQRARHEVGNALKNTAPYSASWGELKESLKRRGVQVQLSEHKKEGGPAVFGVAFEKDGHRFKGSEVAKEYSASKLEQTFAKARGAQSGLTSQVTIAGQTYFEQAANHLYNEQATQAQQAARQQREEAAEKSAQRQQQIERQQQEVPEIQEKEMEM